MTEEFATIVTAFNDCISRKNLRDLSRLLTDDHVFIDSANNRIAGKWQCVEAWRGFFSAFPDYRNHFERVLISGSEVVIVGHSVCSDARLTGPALWTAKLVGEIIAEWRVYEDTGANRALLGLKD